MWLESSCSLRGPRSLAKKVTSEWLTHTDEPRFVLFRSGFDGKEKCALWNVIYERQNASCLYSANTDGFQKVSKH